MALADEFDGFLIDLDGVVWLGRELVPGSVEALRELTQGGKEAVFVTNNPALHPATYAERLRKAGVDAGPEQVVTAGAVAARLAAEAAGAGGVFVIGAAALKEMVNQASTVVYPQMTGKSHSGKVLEGEAGREADVVLVSGHRGFDYEELLTATLALQRGAALFATSRDPTLPMPGGPWPGTGAVLAAVETASGKTAEIAGKPERHLFEAALRSLHCGFSPNSRDNPQRNECRGRVAMVGDRISSDIAGAQRVGLATVLVLSGATSREEAERSETRPDYAIDDLAALTRS
jgi:glycerol-1-phosphatase